MHDLVLDDALQGQGDDQRRGHGKGAADPEQARHEPGQQPGGDIYGDGFKHAIFLLGLRAHSAHCRPGWQ
jgi:hypothetical protein